MRQIELEIRWDGRIELGIKWDDRVVLGRPIRPIGSVDSSFYGLLSDLRPTYIAHWPCFYGSGQLPDGSTRHVPILNNRQLQPFASTSLVVLAKLNFSQIRDVYCFAT